MKLSTTLKAIINANPLCLNLWDESLQNIMCNDQAVLLFSLENKAQYIKEFFKLSPERQPNGRESAELALEHINRAFFDGFNQFRWLHCDLNGNEIPTEVTLNKISMPNGKSFVAGFTRDLRSELVDSTDRNIYESYFLNTVSSKAMLNIISELSNDWLFSLDVRTSLLQFYGKSNNLTGAKGNGFEDVSLPIEQGSIYHEDLEIYCDLINNMTKGICKIFDIRLLHYNGTYRYHRYQYKPIFKNNGEFDFVIGKVSDIDDQKVFEKLSQTDQLTDCYNKTAGEHVIASKLSLSPNKKHTLFIIDIDNFKFINDNFGHYTGDSILKQLSLGFKSYFRNDDVVVRIGGDEFIILIDGDNERKVIESKLNLIFDSFKKLSSICGIDHKVSGSVGVATYPDDASSYDDLYRAADKALYQAKALGKNQSVIYSKQLQEGFRANVTMQEDKSLLASKFVNYSLIKMVFDILYDNSAGQINKALECICRHYECDRCYIFQTSNNGETYDNTYEWCNHGVSKEINNLQNISSDVLEPDFFSQSHNGILYCNNLNEFKSKNAFILMESQGIKSFLHIQICTEDYVSLFIGLDDCKLFRYWSEIEINSFHYVCKIISMRLDILSLQK